jgi:ELWxxDGT repeat protein
MKRNVFIILAILLCSQTFAQEELPLYKITQVADKQPYEIASNGNDLLFFYYDEELGLEEGLYKLNPDDDTPTLIKPMSGAGNNPMVSMNDILYFSATEDNQDYYLYRTDGTYRLTDASDKSFKHNLVVVGNNLYYNSSSETYDRFFATDGNTTRSIVLHDWASPGSLFANNGLLYFAARHEERGYEPYISNGTSTSLLKDINTQDNGYNNDPYPESHSHPGQFTAYGNLTCFIARFFHGDEEGINNHTSELFITNGTEGGTFRVTNFKYADFSMDLHIVAANSSAIYFTTINGWSSKALYVYNGNEVIKLLDDIYSLIKDAIFFNGKLYFLVSAEVAGETELWSTDGTPVNTRKVALVNADLLKFKEYNNELLMLSSNYNYTLNIGLFVYNDSSDEIRQLVSDDGFYTSAFGTSSIAEHNNHLYIGSQSGLHRLELGAKPERIELSHQSALVARRGTLSLTATVVPWNLPITGFEWSSENSNIATVEKYTGLVIGRSTGSTNITATSLFDPEIKTTCMVEVIDANNPDIIDLSFNEEVRPSAIHNYKYDDNNVIHLFVGSDTDLSNLTLDTLILAPLATCEPNLDTITDFSDTVKVTVTSGDGYKTAQWTILASRMINTDNLLKNDISLNLTYDPETYLYPESWSENGIQFNIYPAPSGNSKQHNFSENKLSLLPAMLSIQSKISNDEIKLLEFIVSSTSYSGETCILGYKTGEVIDSVAVYGNSSAMYYQLNYEQGFDSVRIYSNEIYIEGITIWTQSEYTQNAEVTFNITDNGSPLPAAFITINGNDLQTDQNGQAQIALPFGNYNYSVTIDNFETYQGNIDLQENTTVNIEMEPTSAVGLKWQQMTIYPNPFSAHLDINNAHEIASVSILDATGKKMAGYVHNGEPIATIQTKDLEKGIYIIQAITVQGQTIAEKIVKSE